MTITVNENRTLAPDGSVQRQQRVMLRNTLMLLLFLVTFHLPGPYNPAQNADAAPQVSQAGLPNFHVVEPYLWRGGAPNVAGVDELKRHGVTTIVDLRRSQQGVAWESAYAITHGIKYINIPMGDSIPTLTKQRKVLAVIDEAAASPSKGPVFLHCSHGSDRTGFMVACWRVQHEHWSATQAFAEMMAHGFFIHKWQPNPASKLQ